MDAAFALSAFAALFAVVDPFANMPIFVGILERFRPERRAATVRKAHLIALVVMLIFTIAGQTILGFLAIDISSLRIAGGVLLFVIGFEMLFARKTGTEYGSAEEGEGKTLDRIAASPLAVPLITGPGAITTGILLFASAPSALDRVALLGDVVLVMALSYVLIARSDIVFRRLGNSGTSVLVRIMGLLLTAVAVQFIVNGIREAFHAG